jgi:hypothetical protein
LRVRHPSVAGFRFGCRFLSLSPSDHRFSSRCPCWSPAFPPSAVTSPSSTSLAGLRLGLQLSSQAVPGSSSTPLAGFRLSLRLSLSVVTGPSASSLAGLRLGPRFLSLSGYQFGSRFPRWSPVRFFRFLPLSGYRFGSCFSRWSQVRLQVTLSSRESGSRSSRWYPV